MSEATAVDNTCRGMSNSQQQHHASNPLTDSDPSGPTDLDPSTNKTEDNDNHDNNNNKENDNQENDCSMGLASNFRDGSVKKCKKNAIKRTPHFFQQRGLFGKTPFLSKKNCRRCIQMDTMKRTGVGSVSHRGHDARCPRNRMTLGYKSAAAAKQEKMARHLQATNTAPVPFLPNITKDDAQRFMTHWAVPRPLTNHPEINSTKTPKPENTTSIATAAKLDANVPIGQQLRVILDARVKEWKDGKHEGARSCTAPLSVYLMVYSIAQLVTRKREKLPKEGGTVIPNSDWEQFFPDGECVFQFPDDPSRCPSPDYFPLSGAQIFMLDWQQMYPNHRLVCPNCPSGRLCHQRTNFSSNKNLFPVIGANGVPIWGTVMR